MSFEEEEHLGYDDDYEEEYENFENEYDDHDEYHYRHEQEYENSGYYDLDLESILALTGGDIDSEEWRQCGGDIDLFMDIMGLS